MAIHLLTLVFVTEEKTSLMKENEELRAKLETIVEQRVKDMSKAMDYNQKKDAEL